MGFGTFAGGDNPKIGNDVPQKPGKQTNAVPARSALRTKAMGFTPRLKALCSSAVEIAIIASKVDENISKVST